LLNIDASDILPSEDEMEQKEQQAEQMRAMQMATERAKAASAMQGGEQPDMGALLPGAPPPDQGPGENNLGTQPNMENEATPQMLG
jgi:hypothetical protein